MSGGITSQYGFLFQKYVFMDTVISHASMDLFFTYEGADDIDIIPNDDTNGRLFMIASSKNEFVQVKSGSVSINCWAKVLGNWLLMDDYFNSSFTLVCENAMNFSINDSTTIDSVYNYFEKGRSKKRNSIAKRVNEKFFSKYNENEIKNFITNITIKCVISVVSMDTMIENIKQKVFDTYCTDIKIFEKAKQCRLERILEYLLFEIEESIKNKKKYTLTFSKLMELVRRVQTEISDNKYSVNTSKIRKRKKSEAERLVQEDSIREIRQLKLVRDDLGFITSELVNELLYKDFREVYADGGIEIANIEDIAYTNYQETVFESDSTPSAKDLFFNTVKKEIHSSIMENSPIYRKGCYVYLTGEGIDEEKQITWGGVDE